MQELRQSTEMKVRVGSAVDATDGVSPESGLTLGAADQAELLKHNGVATVDISGATFAAITAVDGWYDLTLTTSHTDTLGQLTVVIQDSSLMAPIFRDFMVVTANYWDSKYSTDVLQVDAIQISGDATAANNAELAFDGTGYGFTNCTIPTVTTTTTATNLTNAPTNGDLTATMKTSVNDQVVDVIKTDTTSEMGQGAPPATPTIEEMLAYAYFRKRNKRETTTTEDAIYNNAGDTKLFKSTLSDDGSTFTKQKYGTGA